VKLDQMSDTEIAAELKRQYQVQRDNGAETQMWMSAARIIHHLTTERERRARARRATTKKETPA
jgi:hypothetical protein